MCTIWFCRILVLTLGWIIFLLSFIPVHCLLKGHDDLRRKIEVSVQLILAILSHLNFFNIDLCFSVVGTRKASFNGCFNFYQLDILRHLWSLNFLFGKVKERLELYDLAYFKTLNFSIRVSSRDVWWRWYAVSLLHPGLGLSSTMDQGLVCDQNRFVWCILMLPCSCTHPSKCKYIC